MEYIVQVTAEWNFDIVADSSRQAEDEARQLARSLVPSYVYVETFGDEPVESE